MQLDRKAEKAKGIQRSVVSFPVCISPPGEAVSFVLQLRGAVREQFHGTITHDEIREVNSWVEALLNSS